MRLLVDNQTREAWLRNAARATLEREEVFQRARQDPNVPGKRAPDGFPYETWHEYCRARMALRHTLAMYDETKGWPCPCGSCRRYARGEEEA